MERMNIRKNNLEKVVIGSKIRKARKEAGLTLQNVANISGLSISAISQYERGMRVPDALTMCKLAEILRCPIDEIVTKDYAMQMRISLGQRPELQSNRTIDDVAFKRIEVAYLYMDDGLKDVLACIAESMAKVDRHVQ